MKMHVTLKFTYDLTDNKDHRMEGYGSIDPEECARVDVNNSSPTDAPESFEALVAIGYDFDFTIVPEREHVHNFKNQGLLGEPHLLVCECGERYAPK